MKKKLLTILGCMAFGSAMAQTDLPRVEVFEAQGAVFDSIPGSFVQGVSYNGEWAVGHGTEYTQYSFIWSKKTGEYSLITGSYLDLAYAYSVSNDGTVVGAFYKDVTGENDSLGAMIPGIWKDGAWTELPMENNFIPTEGLEASVNGEACFISGDGAVITGYIQSNSFERSFYDYETGELLEKRNVSLMRPAIWTRKTNGSYKLERKSSSMPTGDELQQGIWSRYGSSQDGTVISVVADHPSGSRCPAVIVGGELVRIYGKEDIDVNLDDQYFYDGASVTVSPNGKYVPGYWSATGTVYDLAAFVYDTEAGVIEELEGWGAATVALDDGTLFGFDGYIGSALYRTADKSFNGSLADYLKLYYGGYNGNLPQTVLSVSGDGKTIGGWHAVADAIGQVSYPSIVVLNGEPDNEPSNVAELENDRRTIIVLGNEVVAPTAVRVELFSAQGTLLGCVDTDRIVLDGTQGVVIAKATYEDGKVEIKKVSVK